MEPLLQSRGAASPKARYAVFHCADNLEPTLDGSGPYYESIDLIDAFHPQTILAYHMNGKPIWRSPTAPRCACGSSASSATSTPNT